MKREINALRTAVYDPPRPYVAILGGIKCDDSLRVARNLIQNGSIDRIAMVGVVGNLMLWASGHNIGEGNREFIRKSLGEAFDETWQDSQKLVSEYQSLLFLPSDLAIEDGGTRKNIGLDDLPTNFPIYDIGIDTMMRLRPLLMEANCLFNGPASYFEKSEFAYGTVEMNEYVHRGNRSNNRRRWSHKCSLQSEGEGRSG